MYTAVFLSMCIAKLQIWNGNRRTKISGFSWTDWLWMVADKFPAEIGKSSAMPMGKGKKWRSHGKR